MTENSDPDEAARLDSKSDSFLPLIDGEANPSSLYTVPRPPCDACERTHHDGRYDVSLGSDEYEVCEDCLEMLETEITRYNWWERLSEAHYDRAAEYLRSLDAVWCVKANAYPGGEMWIHTPFCHAAVVSDVCDHFGFRIRWFSVVSPDEPGFDCVHEHGPCIEINLNYTTRQVKPLPLEYDIIDDKMYSDVAWLEDHHKLFSRDD